MLKEQLARDMYYVFALAITIFGSLFQKISMNLRDKMYVCASESSDLITSGINLRAKI